MRNKYFFIVCMTMIAGMLYLEATAEEPGPSKSTVVRPTVKISDAAREIHRAALIVDGHNDLPWELRDKFRSSFDVADISEPQPAMHTDIPRLLKGNLGAQFWSAYVPSDTVRTGGAVRQTLEQIDIVYQMANRYPDVFEMADTADDILRIRTAGKIACLIGIEGGHSIDNSLGALRCYYRLGARYMTLTHSDSLEWADSATDEARNNGLSLFGIEVIREMNRLGMLVDISHVSPATMHAPLRATKAPIIASHSSAFSVAAHPRNIPDDVLKLIARNGGVVMVNFFSGFVVPESAKIMVDMFNVGRELRVKYSDDAQFKKALREWYETHPIAAGTVHDIVDHLDHIVRIAGIDHAGLVSDFDGVTKLPAQMEDVSCYPYITQELLNRGYTAEQIHKILGLNILRALRQAEAIAHNWTE